MGFKEIVVEIISRVKFRDVLAMTIWSSIILLFMLHGANIIRLPDQVIGGFLVIMQTIVFFYFRKKPRGEEAR